MTDKLQPEVIENPFIQELPTQARKVYVTNIAGYEFENVKEFGELKYLTAGYINLNNPNAILRKVYPKIIAASSNDYLLLTGSNALGAIIFSTWLKVHKQVNLLIFNRKHNTYSIVTYVDTDWVSEEK